MRAAAGAPYEAGAMPPWTLPPIACPVAGLGPEGLTNGVPDSSGEVLSHPISGHVHPHPSRAESCPISELSLNLFTLFKSFTFSRPWPSFFTACLELDDFLKIS